MSEKQKILEIFMGSDAQGKANIIDTIPDRLLPMLDVDSEIYNNLGTSRTAWLAYALRIGPDGIGKVPSRRCKARILPLTRYKKNHHLMSMLLRAKVFVDETVLTIVRHGLEVEMASRYAGALISIGEQALPIIEKILRKKNVQDVTYAFGILNVDNWKNQEALQKLSDVIYTTMVKHTNNDNLLSRCSQVLANTDPERLIRFAIHTMKFQKTEDFSTHPLRESGNYIVQAYQGISSHLLRQEFIIASVNSRMPWRRLEPWDVLLTLAKMGIGPFKKAIANTSEEARLNLGDALQNTEGKDPQDIELIVNTALTAARQLLEEGHAAANLTGFLAKLRPYISDEDYVFLILKIEGQKADTSLLSSCYEYPTSSIAKINEYMQSFEGIARIHAALAILWRTSSGPSYDEHWHELNSAIYEIVEFCKEETRLISMDIVNSIIRIPFHYWQNYVESLLNSSQPIWRAQFAIHLLKEINGQHELAKSTLIQLMRSGDKNTRIRVRAFLESGA
jgi:hypothetical protein